MDQYLAEIRLFGFNFAPTGWLFCDGRLLPIAQYNALFSLLGTTYGGDGVTTFGLPDLRGRVPMGMGNGPSLSPHTIGEKGGSENVALTGLQMPIHEHEMMGSSDTQSTGTVANNSLGTALRGSDKGNIYVPGATNPVRMGISTSAIGGNQPHNNMQPYLAINYCIAYDGIYPFRD